MRPTLSGIERLLQVAEEIQSLSLPGPVLVFGSMSKGAQRPGDIDVVCDLTGLPEPAFGNLSGLLAVCRRHYGWADAFLLSEDDLLVRSDHATSWVRAKNAKGLRKAMADAVPLEQVIDLYRARLAEPGAGEACVAQVSDSPSL